MRSAEQLGNRTKLACADRIPSLRNLCGAESKSSLFLATKLAAICYKAIPELGSGRKN